MLCANCAYVRYICYLRLMKAIEKDEYYLNHLLQVAIEKYRPILLTINIFINQYMRKWLRVTLPRYWLSLSIDRRKDSVIRVRLLVPPDMLDHVIDRSRGKMLGLSQENASESRVMELRLYSACSVVCSKVAGNAFIYGRSRKRCSVVLYVCI